MAWFNTIFNRNLYKQNVINETLSNAVVESLWMPTVKTLNHAENTTAAQGIDSNSERFFGRLPSQGDWFSPPPNPPGNQSWH